MIWAQTGDGVIGRDGGMPWHLPEDLAHFKATTQGHPVIMGRRTWESFPEAFRPLPNRTNIVISSRPGLAAELGSQGAAVVSSLEAALEAAEGSEGSSRIWIVGGSQLYAAAEPLADVAIVTVINTETEGDSYAPRLGPDWTFTAVSPAQDWYTSTNGLQYRIALWTRNRGVTDQDSSQPLA
ncbi:dihydrofolate reductase [Arthrobacter sp. Sa2BUA2]|uniref:Dihydrofolate reductase n=2 Tax=Arthrobacter pullicola TaxID=2762224 RepID=A0ABR8YI75_9MICC|nr:dihydrofolate reductase [Arthrobacter pullicola]